MSVFERASEPTAPGAALFGKLPSRTEYVRERFAGSAARRLDAWLVKAVEDLHYGRAHLPEATVRFALSFSDEQSLLLGVLSASRDYVGREFPITVFCTLPLASVAGKLAALPLAARVWCAEAEQLVRDAPSLAPHDLLARLDRLKAPDFVAIDAAAERVAHTLASTEAGELLTRTVGVGNAPYYAAHTLLAATAAMRTSASTVLDCPIGIDVDLFAWVRLCERLVHGTHASASFVWLESEAPRLLISLGAPSPQLLQFLCAPGQASTRLWPLTTTRDGAAEQARSLLEAALPRVDGGAEVSVSRWIEAVLQRCP